MTTEFKHYILQTADDIIAMSELLKDRMESWANVFVRLPDSPNVNVTAGFITNWTVPNVMELLVEVRAPQNDTAALVRIQSIETIKDNAGNERFNQVSLHFQVDYAAARQLVEQGGSATRQDIADLAHYDSSTIARIIISDDTGKDTATDQLLGKRYDLDGDDLTNITSPTEQELMNAINKVLPKLQQTAKNESTK